MTAHPDSDAFLILHGWENHRPDAHWQHWLNDALLGRGFAVGYPQLPDADTPSLAEWTAVLLAELSALRGRRVTVVAHSLGVLLWMRAAEARLAPLVDRVLLVSPPSASVVGAHPAVEEFAWTPAADAARGPASAGASAALVVASDADPFCPAGAEAEFAAPLGLPLAIVPGAGHITVDDGFGPWPAVLEWAIAGTGFAASTVTADAASAALPAPE